MFATGNRPVTRSAQTGSARKRPPLRSNEKRRHAIAQRPGFEVGAVSRFLFYSAIYLRDLPPGIGRAALICQYIWFCRFRDRTRVASLSPVVSSCLAFSPLAACPGRSSNFSPGRSPECGRLFSVTVIVRLPPPALSAAECPFLSGLSSRLSGRSLQLFSSGRKVTFFCRFA